MVLMKRSSLALETLLAAVLPDIDGPGFIGEQAVASKAAPMRPPRTTALTDRSENLARRVRDRFRVSDAKRCSFMLSPEQLLTGRVSQSLAAPARV
jgi:hypothetical protein